MTKGGRLFVIGGLTGDATSEEIVRYHQPQDVWDVVAHMSTSRSAVGSAADGDTAVYLLGAIDTEDET